MSKPVKRSVSLALFDEFGRVLAVQRPEDDEDLPNAWGLPASSLRAGESWDDAIRRTGRDKLGVDLKPIRELNRGTLERASYTLDMRLYEAEVVRGTVTVPQVVVGVTQYQNWRWGTAEVLRPAAERGSLCCRLFLDSIS
jgi:isopentenyldiphosphate isomerase